MLTHSSSLSTRSVYALCKCIPNPKAVNCKWAKFHISIIALDMLNIWLVDPSRVVLYSNRDEVITYRRFAPFLSLCEGITQVVTAVIILALITTFTLAEIFIRTGSSVTVNDRLWSPDILELFITTVYINRPIWRHGTPSRVVQVIDCFLTAPNHYLNQYWLIITGVSWTSPEGNFIRNAQDTYHCNEFVTHQFNFTVASPRDQRDKFVKIPQVTCLIIIHYVTRKFNKILCRCTTEQPVKFKT